ncbi:uncharacterized protein FIESC28_00648 [Fusarium coffeatum]|uniref:Uncharacterized protein n=1 Tax=Fusarium coffeatum TaxID=231269 RepID=A0A366SB23_9HYPO|nr:uncharacterized protein FIESC28_00648 [Fusarium coffeatum]RBR26531.1 hypothetical protein FIESC28_00648 [Fusarium coffeatum]
MGIRSWFKSRSLLNSGQTHESRPPPPYDSTPTHFKAQGHTQSCQVYSEWEESGEASTNYSYEVWVLPESCLSRLACDAQIRCLEHWSELQMIHGSEVKVRCILHDRPSDSQDTKLGVYKDMMYAKSLNKIYDSWNRRGFVHTAFTQRNFLATIDDEIDKIIKFSRQNPDAQIGKVKDELSPFLVATIAKSQEGWSLGEFLKRKDEIFDKRSLLPYSKSVALAAQFKLQSVSAFQASNEQTSQAFYTVNFLPDMIANVTYDAIRGFFAPAEQALKKKVKIGDQKGRSDSYCLKLISFGSGNTAEGGAQWQQWDDAYHGDEDRTDHTFINAKRILVDGPGPMLGKRVILGAAVSHLDRTSSKKRTDPGLYGDGTDLDIEEWRKCPACERFQAVR